MPQVASDVKAYTPPRPTAPARAPQAPDRAPATPFEDLLDTTQADNSPPPPAADRAPRADADQPPAAADAKPVKNGDTTKSDAKTDSKTDANTKADGSSDDTKAADGEVKTGKPKTDAKITTDAKKSDADKKLGDATVTDDTKPATDAKTPDADAVAVAVAPNAAAVQATATAVTPDPAATAPQPASGDIVALDALPATKGAGDPVITAAIAAKLEKAAAPKADTGKAADDLKQAANDAAQPRAEAKGLKPQATSADDVKTTNTHPRGEAQADDNRPAASHVASAINTEPANTVPKAGGDVPQPTALNAPQQAAPTAPATPAAPQLPPQVAAAAIPLAGVGIEIASKAQSGTNHFEIRLDPPELGRIEVRLNVDRDGNVTSRLIADRQDTLDLLRRDSAGLERALQDAGLKTSDNGLQYSLRDQSGQQQQQSNQSSNLTRLTVTDDMVSAADSTQRIYSRLAGQGSGVDIHV